MWIVTESLRPLNGATRFDYRRDQSNGVKVDKFLQHLKKSPELLSDAGKKKK